MTTIRLMFTLSLLSINPNVFAQSSDQSELTKCSRVWIHAIIKGDSAALSKILANDYTIVSSIGKASRSALLTRTATALGEEESVMIDSLDVRLIQANVGLLTGYLTWTYTENGMKKIRRTCYQDVYVKRNNQWLDVSSHVLRYDTK